jgi:RHS repeat-associated protein
VDGDGPLGELEYSGATPAVAESFFGLGKVLSLVKTIQGWRAYEGAAAFAVELEGTGHCAHEFRVESSSEGPTFSPENACSGTVSFREAGRRNGNEQPGIFVSPQGKTTFAFGPHSPRVIEHSYPPDHGGGPGSDCGFDAPIDPGLDCLAGQLAQAGMGGPMNIDCGSSWPVRGADPSMDCGSIFAPNLPSQHCAEWDFAGGDSINHSMVEYERVSIVRTVDAVGPGQDAIWLYFADDRGRILTVMNGATFSREDYQYDVEGRIVGNRVPFGVRQCREYDGDWNVVRNVTFPAREKWSPDERIERRFEFAAFGRPSVVYDPVAPEQPLVSYSWDDRGNLRAVHHQDPAEDIAIVPDARGRPVSVTYPQNLVVEMEYDESVGEPELITTTMSDPHHVQVVEIEYDDLGREIEVTQLGRPSREYRWTNDGRLMWQSVTLDSSNGSMPLLTQYFYDNSGMIELVVEPETERYYKHTSRGLLQELERKELGTSVRRIECYRYDARGRLVEAVDPAGRRTWFTRNSEGNVATVRKGIRAGGAAGPWDDRCAVTDGATAGEEVFANISYSRGLPFRYEGTEDATGPGLSLEIDYDAFGRPFETRFRGGASQRTRYDVLGRVEFLASYSSPPAPYDPGLRLPDTTDPKLMSLSTVSYDSRGRPLEHRSLAFVDEPTGRRLLSADGWLRTTYSYNPAIGEKVVGSASGNSTSYTHDALGRIRKVQLDDPDNTKIEYTYDNQGRAIYEDTTPSSADGGRSGRTITLSDFGSVLTSEHGGVIVESYDYDDFGRMIYSDSRLERKSYRWNSFGEMMSVDRVRANGALEPHLYLQRNVLGDIREVGTGAGRLVTRTFDFANRLKRETYSDTSYVQHSYWKGSTRPKTRRDRLGNVSTFTYDDLGQLASVEATNTYGAYAGMQPSRLVYNNSLLGMSSAMSLNKPSDPADDVTTSFVRDSLGRVQEERSSVFPNSPARMTYDEAQHSVTTVLDTNTVVREYDDLGRLAGVKLDGANIVSKDFNGAGPPITLIYGNGLTESRSYDVESRLRTISAAPRFGARLYYSAEGTLVRQDNWAGTASAVSTLYIHDELGRLSSGWRATNLPTSGFFSGSITSAQVQAWTQGATRNESYVLNPSDSWTSATSGSTNIAITLGADERVTNFSGGAIGTDTDGRMISRTSGRQYGYDSLGRMVSMSTAANSSWSFQYDAFGRIVSWSQPQGSYLAQTAGDALVRIRTAGQDTLHVLDENSTPLAVAFGATKHYNHSTFGGRLLYATGSDNAIVEKYSYSAYGKVTITNPQNQTLYVSGIGNRLFLTGQMLFPEAGLYRLGQRFYSPELGRFTTPDPLGYVDGPNVFAYTGSQPVMYTDADGLSRSDSTAYALGRGLGRLFGEDVEPALKGSTYNLLGPAGFMIGQYNQLTETQEAIDAARAEGGLLNAINLFNPFYGMLVAGEGAYNAIESGDVENRSITG